VIDVSTPTHGVASVVGVITLIAGMQVLLNQPGGEEFGRLSAPLVITLSIGTALFFGFIVAKGLRAQRARPVTGAESLVGALGIARGDLAPEGFVFVQGERWMAVAEEDEVKVGARVEVVAMDGMRLKVRCAPDSE
jgi:membrane-bound serine protease (ClpP class)